MVLVAELAVWVLSPGEQPPDPVPVSASRYFAPAELERAVDFRDGQRWLAIGGLAIEGALLLTLALGHPRRCAGGSSGSRRARCSGRPPPAPGSRC